VFTQTDQPDKGLASTGRKAVDSTTLTAKNRSPARRILAQAQHDLFCIIPPMPQHLAMQFPFVLPLKY
jgi:hypothetical protein